MTTYWRSKGKEETLGKQHLMFYVYVTLELVKYS